MEHAKKKRNVEGFCCLKNYAYCCMHCCTAARRGAGKNKNSPLPKQTIVFDILCTPPQIPPLNAFTTRNPLWGRITWNLYRKRFLDSEGLELLAGLRPGIGILLLIVVHLRWGACLYAGILVQGSVFPALFSVRRGAMFFFVVLS